MKIGIDARMYGPRQGGIGRYIEQLIPHLEKIDRTNEYVIFLRKENWQGYNPSAPNFKKVLADIPWYGWAEQARLPKIIGQNKVDLMHFPHWNVPLFYNGPYVVTVHDLLLLHYPTRAASTLGPLTYWFKNLAYKYILRHAARMAKKIIAPSEFTKKDIIGTLHIAAEKIEVVHMAPYKKITEEKPAAGAPGITKPYILYVGVAFPHKNLEGLLEAWKIFTEKYGNNSQLVLAGKHNYFYKKIISGAKAGNVVFTGFLNDSDLAVVYKNASLYIFPTFYEGFGMPPLEAMQYGIPVISSNSTCLPEILGGAAYYFNPADTAEMAEAMHRGLTDQNLRQSLMQKTSAILAKYSWNNTAKNTLDIYNQILPSNPQLSTG